MAMLNVVSVAAGGALGAVARYAVVLGVQSACPRFQPLGTMVVNVVGCLLVGLVMGCLASTKTLNTPLQFFLVTGILGGFTTFSAFGYETATLLQQKQAPLALWNVVGNLALGFPAVFAGLHFAEWLNR